MVLQFKINFMQFYKAILHKKVYPRHSSPQTKKYLEKRRKETACDDDDDDDDEMHIKGEKGGQWVRTDSECK